MTAGTADGRWTDLADSEILRRLTQRGYGVQLAERMLKAARRGDTPALAMITGILER